MPSASGEFALRLSLWIFTAIVAAGCASQPAAPPQPVVNLSGYPPAFRQGYTDGCVSAKATATRTRDENRFKSDANYAQGWQDGYSICKAR